MLARLLFFGKKVNCTNESHSPAVYMSLFSESNAHREVVEVFAMPKNIILRLIDFLRTGARKPAVFDSKSARVARTPCTRPRPGKLSRGLSQCEVHGGMATVVV